MTWEEAVEDPALADLPYKIELDGYGNIVMSPTLNPHGNRQFKIGLLLSQQLSGGSVAVEIGVRTSDNVKVADVVWFTAEHWRIAESESACSTAPAICVEVTSKSNYQRELHRKKALYFEAGAKEVWICDRMGNMTFHTPEGQVAKSPMCPNFPATV